MGQSLDVVYLDFSKAFDRVSVRRLLLKLDHCDIKGGLLKWIEGFLSDSTFQVKIGNSTSSPVSVLSGVPQGSVLGPLLFSVYTSDIVNGLKSSYMMFADEMKHYNKSSNYDKLATDIMMVNEWSKEWLLSMNLKKSVILHIGKHNPRQNYHLDNEQLDKSSYVRDLGVLITIDLSWPEHVSYIAKKANKIRKFLLKGMMPLSHIRR